MREWGRFIDIFNEISVIRYSKTISTFSTFAEGHPPVIVEDLCEDARMPVEEVLVEDGIVVGQGLREPRQPRRGDLLQGGLVGLVSDAAYVEHDAILRVHVDEVHGCKEE